MPVHNISIQREPSITSCCIPKSGVAQRASVGEGLGLSHSYCPGHISGLWSRPILEEKRKLRCGHFAAWGVDIRLLVLITLRLVAERLCRGDNRDLEIPMHSEAALSVETGQVPNQLTISAPTFDPSTDDVEIWSSKVELLSATWPRQRITELATRLILGCKGRLTRSCNFNVQNCWWMDQRAFGNWSTWLEGCGDRFLLERGMRL